MNVGPETSTMAHNEDLIRIMSHACKCRNANCGLPPCMKMKRVFAHTKLCKLKTFGGCPICKQLITHCSYHANNCQVTMCPVPFCPTMKHRLKQLQLQQGQQQTLLLQSQKAAGSPQSIAAPVTPLVSPHQPNIGLKPGTLTVVKQKPSETTQKQAPYGRGLEILASPAMQRNGNDNLLLIVKWNPQYPTSISVSLILILIFIAMIKIIVF